MRCPAVHAATALAAFSCTPHHTFFLLQCNNWELGSKVPLSGTKNDMLRGARSRTCRTHPHPLPRPAQAEPRRHARLSPRLVARAAVWRGSPNASRFDVMLPMDYSFVQARSAVCTAIAHAPH